MVCVRVEGEMSLGWVEGAHAWGESIELVVAKGPKLNHLIHKILPNVLVSPFGKVFILPCLSPWEGIMFATLRIETKESMIGGLFLKWHPQIAIFGIHHFTARSEVKKLTPRVPNG